ncbi:hypothetical protein PMW_114 [Pseudomonas phage phiPMW]|uniref:Uncharacterized protein n=1 Tax=Pseudomonas phage phiPMW TaxID=1815582 RepID=A0A1S5R1G9_9CAUD|nr:hypothetical protein FDG97_gp114 [Pseudomonas phage phiPMW]ANA49239.1 hypothetical protein PMW_114 [Pseudomonas phage phiPMW]
MWALILTTALIGSDYRTDGSTHTEFMPGFATYDLCVEAGNQIPAPPSNYYTKGSAKFICVKMK